MTDTGPQHPGYWTPNRTAPRLGSSGRPANTYAWLGLGISASGFLVPLLVNGILGAVFSLIGMRDARRLRAAGHEDTGGGIALAGLILGVVHALVTAAIIVAAVFAFQWFIEWVENLPVVYSSTIGSSLSSAR